jgi:hypothetical protein
MADLTLCISSECPLRDSCHRFTCPPSEWQSYAAFFSEGEKCSYYWPAREKRDDSLTQTTEN